MLEAKCGILSQRHAVPGPHCCGGLLCNGRSQQYGARERQRRKFQHSKNTCEHTWSINIHCQKSLHTYCILLLASKQHMQLSWSLVSILYYIALFHHLSSLWFMRLSRETLTFNGFSVFLVDCWCISEDSSYACNLSELSSVIIKNTCCQHVLHHNMWGEWNSGAKRIKILLTDYSSDSKRLYFNHACVLLAADDALDVSVMLRLHSYSSSSYLRCTFLHLHIPLTNTTILEYTEYPQTAMETELKKKLMDILPQGILFSRAISFHFSCSLKLRNQKILIIIKISARKCNIMNNGCVLKSSDSKHIGCVRVRWYTWLNINWFIMREKRWLTMGGWIS